MILYYIYDFWFLFALITCGIWKIWQYIIVMSWNYTVIQLWSEHVLLIHVQILCDDCVCNVFSHLHLCNFFNNFDIKHLSVAGLDVY
jgi:hypothetical protein